MNTYIFLNEYNINFRYYLVWFSYTISLDFKILFLMSDLYLEHLINQSFIARHADCLQCLTFVNNVAINTLVEEFAVS